MASSTPSNSKHLGNEYQLIIYPENDPNAVPLVASCSQNIQHNFGKEDITVAQCRDDDGEFESFLPGQKSHDLPISGLVIFNNPINVEQFYQFWEEDTPLIIKTFKRDEFESMIPQVNTPLFECRMSITTWDFVENINEFAAYNATFKSRSIPVMKVPVNLEASERLIYPEAGVFDMVFGYSATDIPATVPFNTLTARVNPTDPTSVQYTATADGFYNIFVPDADDLSAIYNRETGENITAQFTKTSAVRVEGGTSLTSYVIPVVDAIDYDFKLEFA